MCWLYAALCSALPNCKCLSKMEAPKVTFEFELPITGIQLLGERHGHTNSKATPSSPEGHV